MRIGILIKGNSKHSSSSAEELTSLLRAQNFDIKVSITHSSDTQIQLKELIESNCNLIVATGGDGTLHECINMIMRLNLNSTLKLAHFPIGTANDFAKTINQSSEAISFIKQIKNGKFTNIDIGLVTTEFSNTPNYFINIADAGIGGEIIHRVNSGNKKLGTLTYPIHLIKGLLTFKKKDVFIRYDDQESYSGKLLSLVIANGHYFANGLHIAPHASITSGKFAITQFGNVSIWDYFRNIRKIKKGLFLDHPEVKYAEASHIELYSKEKIYHMEADGEYIGHSAAKITILPKAIEFLLPPQ